MSSIWIKDTGRSRELGKGSGDAQLAEGETAAHSKETKEASATESDKSDDASSMGPSESRRRHRRLRAGRAVAVRPQPYPGHFGRATGMYSTASACNGLPWGWEGHDYLQAAMLQSIPPAMLQSTQLGLSESGALRRSSEDHNRDQALSETLMGVGSPTDMNGGGYSGGPPSVKFVNATMEILQNQMKKEEIPKKRRTRTTPQQLHILQKAFNTDPMPDSGARLALAKKIGMNARAVQVWFQNRRAKEKLDARKAEVVLDHRDKPSRSNSTPEGNPQLTPNSLQQQARTQSLGAFLKNGYKGSYQTKSNPNIYDQQHSMYDLGMYFGEQENFAQALAQYATNLELGSFAFLPQAGTGGGNSVGFYGENDPLAKVGSQMSASAEVSTVYNPAGYTMLPAAEETEPDTNQFFTRFQSMPSAFGGVYSPIDGSPTENALGLVFPAEEHGASPSSYPNSEGAPLGSQQTFEAGAMLGSLGSGRGGSGGEIFGNLMLTDEPQTPTEVRTFTSEDLDSHIFARPASKETFLTSTSAGQSIPMPSAGPKQRSASVPDISRNVRADLGLPIVDDYRGHAELLSAIHEEEDLSTLKSNGKGAPRPSPYHHHHRQYGHQHPNQQISGGMGGVGSDGLEEIHIYLGEMNANSSAIM